MSEKAGAKLPCPLCGHPLDPGASKCDNCGASVPKQTKDSLALLMKVLNVTPEQAARLYNLGYRKPDDLKEKNLWDVLEEEPKLFLCPECGAFVHEKDQKCQRCGAEFAGEAMEIEDYLLREERPCPHCGEPIHTDAILCPTCGKPVAEAKGVTLGSTYMCPSCGVTVLEGQKECEVCGASLSPTALIASKAMEMEAKACPKCGGTLDPETGICPFCSKKAEAEPDEAMEEIDQFLEHLASTPPGGGKLKVSPEEKPAKPPQMFVVEPPKPEIEKVAEKPLEKAPVTMEELEAEVALEQLEEEVKTLPMIKVLRPSHSKLPRSPPPVEAPAESGTLILVAELMLYATAFCLSLQYFASKTGSAALEWALFLFFGAAFGLSLGIIVLASKGMKAGMLRAWPQVVGTILIIAVPLERYLAASLSLGETYWFLGSTPYKPLDIVGILLIVVGLALWIPFTLRARGRTRWIATMAGGSAIAAVLTPANVLPIDFGGDLMAALLWLSTAALVLTGVALSLEVRWARGEIDLSLRLGEEEFRKREFRKSVEDYDRAIKMARRSGQDDLATPWYSKGAALVVLGRYDEALSAIDEALRINPNNEMAWVNKGNALSRMGDYRRALKAFNAALRANPRYEVAWNNKGNTLARLGRYGESLKCYDLALHVDPDYRGAWVNKGYVLAKVGEFEEAAKCAERAMTLTTGAPA